MHQRGHYANACPQRTPKKDAESITSPESLQTNTMPLMKRSLRRSNEVSNRATLACCIGDVSNVDSIKVQANVDSFSDVNLVPEQWWPMLRGEGIAKQILSEPIVLEWGIGNNKTILKEFVELSVQIAGWKDLSRYFTSKFYLSKNDGNALTLGYQLLRRVGILRVLEPLIELQRQLGLLSNPFPKINPAIQNRNGVDVPLVKPLRIEESDRLSDQSQMNVLSTSVSVCNLPLQFPNQSARSEETGDDISIGSSNFELMEIVLQETIEPEVVNGKHCHATAVPNITSARTTDRVTASIRAIVIPIPKN